MNGQQECLEIDGMKLKRWGRLADIAESTNSSREGKLMAIQRTQHVKRVHKCPHR